MRNLDTFSISQLAALDQDWMDFSRRKAVETYREFIDVLYDDLARIADDIERNRAMYQADSEDKLSHEICKTLRQWCYAATHGASRSGHTDIFVSGHQGRFEWIGEAKIFTDLGVMRQGFLQHTTRYSGSINDRHGGVIAYVRRENAVGHMTDWKQDLQGTYASMQFSACDRRGELGFVTVHRRDDTGGEIELWHFGIALNSDPKDKSGLRRKRKA